MLTSDENKTRQRRNSMDWGNQTVVQTRFAGGIHAQLHCTLVPQLYTTEGTFGQHPDIKVCSRYKLCLVMVSSFTLSHPDMKRSAESRARESGVLRLTALC